MRTIGHSNYSVRIISHKPLPFLKIIGDHGNKTHHSVVKHGHTTTH